MTNLLDAWIAEVTTALDVDPATVDRDLLLDVSRLVHGVTSRLGSAAPPLTIYVLGLAAGLHGGGTEALTEAATTLRRLAVAHSPAGH